jgi:O-antigen/teichoic acid export membrane protein
VLVVLVLSQFFAVSQTPSVALMFGISKHKFFALMSSVEGVLNLVLSLVLVRFYGLVGVALGTMVPMVLSKLVIQPLYVSRVSVVGYTEYVKTMARTLATALVSLVLPFVVTMEFVRPDYGVLFLLGSLSAIVYALSLWLFEFSSRETRLLQDALWLGWLRTEPRSTGPVSD